MHTHDGRWGRVAALAAVLVMSTLLAACAAEGGEDSAAPVEDGAVDDHMDDDMGMDSAMGDGPVAGESEGEHAEGEDMHAEALHVDPPAEYAGLTNPYEGDPQAIAAGEEIYNANCATCHGEEGHGDGPAAQGLDPAPASLADRAMMGDMSDGLLFWRVTEGGAMEPFNSAMPAWGDVLTEEERWQVISYIRTLGE